jgi:thiol-disulfide isomerase/thioredoxin
MNLRLYYTLLLLCLVFCACKDINLEIAEEGETPYLLGKVDREGLEGPNYIAWFQENYEDFELDMTTISELKNELGAYDILVFLGTWCDDSQLQVPQFYKILDACDFPENQLTVVALSEQDDLYKQSPTHEEAGLNIEYVPTFILFKDDTEVGRIEEFPADTLEKDMLAIISDNNN